MSDRQSEAEIILETIRRLARCREWQRSDAAVDAAILGTSTVQVSWDPDSGSFEVERVASQLPTLPAPRPLDLGKLPTTPITITDKPKPKLNMGQIWSVERWGSCAPSDSQ